MLFSEYLRSINPNEVNNNAFLEFANEAKNNFINNIKSECEKAAGRGAKSVTITYDTFHYAFNPNKNYNNIKKGNIA